MPGKRTPTVLIAPILLYALTNVGIQAQEPGGPHLELPEIIERGESGPTLLMIPCAGCGAQSWERFMAKNQHRFRMIAVTLPGYDASPRPELPLWTDSTVFQDNALRQISKLIDDRELSDVVLVGHSFGVTMALRLAALRPDVVRALVGVDSSPTSPARRAMQSPQERLAEARETVDEGPAIQLQEPSAYRRFNGARTLPDAESRLLHHGMFMGTDRVAMLHYWRENILRDANPEFRALEIPYLDIDATGPGVANPDSVAAAHVARLDSVGRPADYRLSRFWETSHWVPVERPEALGTVILDFLEGREVTDYRPTRRSEGDSPSDSRPGAASPCR